MLIAISLIAIILISILSILSGNVFVGVTFGFEEAITTTINGTQTTIEFGTSDVFFIDPVLGAIVILVAIGILVGVLGFNAFGSGFNDTATRIILWVTVYGALWGLFSVLAMNLILEIQIFGSLLYLSLTIMYFIGVIQKISQG